MSSTPVIKHIGLNNVNNEKLTEPFANVTQSEFQEYRFTFVLLTNLSDNVSLNETPVIFNVCTSMK